MPQDKLGLFDTSPDRQEIRLSLAIAGLMLVALSIILPGRDVRWPEIVAFVPTIDAVMFVGELITATLLYAQAGVFRSRALSILASGYAFAALLLVPHMLTFPGAFAPDGLLGAGVNTTAWISVFRRIAFPIVIIFYVWLRRSDLAAQAGAERPTAKIGTGVLVAIGLAAAVTMLTTIGHDFLPSYFINRSDLNIPYADAYQGAALTLFLFATAMLFRERTSVLDIWLLVALWGWLIESILIISLPGRFTAGWYGFFVLMLFSHLVVMLALIAESNRLYARLALATAARNREQEARLTSMEAVASVISHEIGQPLSAVTTSMMAALSWLNRPKPNPEMAQEALRSAIDAGQRTFDVIKSIRATFAKAPGPITQYSLNELARETASLLDREMAAKKVSVEFELDEALPPIQADRIQMQRVLLNLLTNAIESLAMVQGRRRRIAIRSASLDDLDVVIEVADTGVGIPPDQLPHIFDAFFTTKARGTGLGLFLCRTIVEDHGGALWASPGERNGAIFHLRLPRSRLPAA